MDFEEKDPPAFTWTSLFIVTGVSCLVFSLILQILDENSNLFFRLGLGGVGLGILSYLNQWLGRKIFSNKPMQAEQE